MEKAARLECLDVSAEERRAAVEASLTPDVWAFQRRRGTVAAELAARIGAMAKLRGVAAGRPRLEEPKPAGCQPSGLG